MSKKNELWVAFAEDDMTCKVMVSDSPTGHLVDVVLTGTIVKSQLFIIDLIESLATRSECNTAVIDARGLVFFSGRSVNEEAVEAVLKLVYYFTQRKMIVHFLLEDGCVKDTLKFDLSAIKFPTMDITDNQPPPATNGYRQKDIHTLQGQYSSSGL